MSSFRFTRNKWILRAICICELDIIKKKDDTVKIHFYIQIQIQHKEILPEVTSPEVMWPEVTSLEASLTGTGSHGSDHVCMHNRFPHFFLTIVVQNVSLRMTDMVAKDQVTPKGFLWKGVRKRNRKLRNIRPSGAFSPEVTWPKGFPWEAIVITRPFSLPCK